MTMTAKVILMSDEIDNCLSITKTDGSESTILFPFFVCHV
jgi:hypothetical protein